MALVPKIKSFILENATFMILFKRYEKYKISNQISTSRRRSIMLDNWIYN